MASFGAADLISVARHQVRTTKRPVRLSFDGANASKECPKVYSCTEWPRAVRMWQKGTVALKAERAGSVGEKLAKMERRSIWETWLFVGVDALAGTRCRPIPFFFFLKEVQVRSSPLRKLAEVKVSGLPWRSLIANQLPSKRASYWQRSLRTITGIGFLAGAKQPKARPT
jgi:hypothetical protein